MRLILDGATALSVHRLRGLRTAYSRVLTRETNNNKQTNQRALDEPGLRDRFGERWAPELVAQRSEAALRGLLRARGAWENHQRDSAVES